MHLLSTRNTFCFALLLTVAFGALAFREEAAEVREARSASILELAMSSASLPSRLPPASSFSSSFTSSELLTHEEPALVPYSFCWEQKDRAQIDVYFGYLSRLTNITYLPANTPQNQILGLPAAWNDSYPTTTFLPGEHAVSMRLTVPSFSVVQWRLNGYTAMLDASIPETRCSHQFDLEFKATWKTRWSAEIQDRATAAVALVAAFPSSVLNVTWQNNTFGPEETAVGLTGTWKFSKENPQLYRSFYELMSDLQRSPLGESKLQHMWMEELGEKAESTVSLTNSNSKIQGWKSPAFSSFSAALKDNLTPVAHCWLPSSHSGNTVDIFFGYYSSFNRSVTLLPGDMNWMANAPRGWNVPSLFYPGYNGFTLRVSSDQNATYLMAWNLAGNTAAVNITKETECKTEHVVRTFYVLFAGTNVGEFNQTTASQAIEEYVRQQTNAARQFIDVSFTPTSSSSFVTTVSIHGGNITSTIQYAQATDFVAACNDATTSFSIRSSLANLVGHDAHVVQCQAPGTDMEQRGFEGTTSNMMANSSLNLDHFSLTPTCWKPILDTYGIIGYFGFENSDLSWMYAKSAVQGATKQVLAPTVFASNMANPYAAKIVAASNVDTITWSIGDRNTTLTRWDPARLCVDTAVSVSLTFERHFKIGPPNAAPILEWVSRSVSYPLNGVSGEWNLSPTSNLVLSVHFLPLHNLPQKMFKHEEAGVFSVPRSEDPRDAAMHLVSLLTDNFTLSEQISIAASGYRLFGATTGTQMAQIPVPPISSAPASPPSPSSPILSLPKPTSQKSSPSQRLAFSLAIVVGILGFLLLLGVATLLFVRRRMHLESKRRDYNEGMETADEEQGMLTDHEY